MEFTHEFCPRLALAFVLAGRIKIRGKFRL